MIRWALMNSGNTSKALAVMTDLRCGFVDSPERRLEMCEWSGGWIWVYGKSEVSDLM